MKNILFETFSGMFEAAGCILLFVTLPSLLELLVVTTGALRKQRKLSPKRRPAFSLAVVVPAHNEEYSIARCVTSLLSSAASLSDISIFVVADNCSDRTADCARAAGADVLVRTNPSERGKGFALRFAFDNLMPRGYDACAVVDADSVVSNNFLCEVIAALSSGEQAVQTRYRVATPLITQRARLMDVAFLAFNVLRPKGRHGYGLSAGVLGNGFALSRQTLMDVPYEANSIVEDLEYHLLLVESGKRVAFIDEATVYGDISDDKEAQETQRARWEGGRMRLALTKVIPLIRQLLVGRLLVFEPLLELLTLPLAYLIILLVAMLALPILGYRLYAVTLMVLMLVHVVTALRLSGEMKEGLSSLVFAPSYILWKLTKSGAILRFSKSGKPWLRTKRPADTKTGLENA